MGLISVGPQSAGADPGPICYQRGGTRPTITDANLVLGYLNPDFFNGGAMKLDVAGAAEGISRDIGAPLGLSLENAAWGIHRIANANMERAMRIVSIDRGRDPRRYTLVAFGGAGPLHACRLASTIGIPRVIVPHGAGVGSAFGLLSAEHKSDLAVTHILELSDDNVGAITQLFDDIEARVKVQAARHARSRNIVAHRSVWVHYVGQGYEVRVDLPPGKIDAAYLAKAREAFYAEYKREYGYIDPESRIEGTEWYVAATPASGGNKVSFKRSSGGAGEPVVGTRKAYFPELGGLTSCKVIDRYRMKPSARFEGPALIEERESTTVVRPGDTASVSAAGHLIIEIGKGAA
jgi:N-methylhydantoinase A